VYRAARLPDGGTVDYTPTVVLREATDVIWGIATHSVAGARGGRLATSILRAVTSASIVTTLQDYELPPMAVGDTIDSVTWVNAAGTMELPLQVVPLGLEATISTPSSVGVATHYALLDGCVRIYPRPSESGSLRIVYQRRHGQLVASGTDNGVVLAVTNSAGVAKIGLTATAPATFLTNVWVDFISSRYPYRTKIHGARIVAQPLAPGFSASEFAVDTTFTAATQANLVGDTACLYSKTPFVSLPMELRRTVTLQTAAKIASDLGDERLAQRSLALAERDKQLADQLLTPRTKAQREKAYNPRSLMRSTLRSRGRFWVD
jgi:hypothetical protein